MAQRVWGGWRCDKLTQTGNFYPCRRYPCAAIVPEVLPTGDKRFGVKIGERNANLGIWIWGLPHPHPPPTNPQPMSVRPTTGGKRRGGRGAGIRHTHPPSPGSPASVSVQGKRPLDDSTVPSKRPDVTHLQSYTHLRLQTCPVHVRIAVLVLSSLDSHNKQQQGPASGTCSISSFSSQAPVGLTRTSPQQQLPYSPPTLW